jgi:hypothetical protein
MITVALTVSMPGLFPKATTVVLAHAPGPFNNRSLGAQGMVNWS